LLLSHQLCLPPSLDRALPPLSWREAA
jgi:hypothetical protein